MRITPVHRKQIVASYCILFYVLMLFKWWNGLFLYQLKPFVFANRLDMVTWFFMQSGIHQSVINNTFACVVFDICFYSMPLLYWLVFLKNKKWASVLAVCMLLVNWTYVQVFTLFPGNSTEGHIVWLLFPFLFMTIDLRRFYFILHALRYFFLFFFASAGIWKIVQGGIFNLHQMSGVLLFQHKEYIVSSPNSWYSYFTYWLINHPFIGYLLYAFGTLAELAFIVGFFTKRADKWLTWLFLLFLLMDVVIMRIHYWETLPFLLTFMYSRFKKPSKKLLRQPFQFQATI